MATVQSTKPLSSRTVEAMKPGDKIKADCLFLDGVYIERCNGSSRFRWVKAPTGRGGGQGK